MIFESDSQRLPSPIAGADAAAVALAAAATSPRYWDGGPDLDDESVRLSSRVLHLGFMVDSEYRPFLQDVAEEIDRLTVLLGERTHELLAVGERLEAAEAYIRIQEGITS